MQEDRSRAYPAAAFAAWITRHNLTERHAAHTLGCAPSTIRSWKRSGAPLYVKLACEALDGALRLEKASVGGGSSLVST